jgi:hypothetical protein
MGSMARFDHAVVVAGLRMDAAVGLFRRLGFLVTERGYHTLGSINHLIVLGETYIELLGLPPDRPDARPELRDSVPGLDALVFGSDDAQATWDEITARAAPVGPVQAFSRPVRTADGERDAAFRTVRCLPGSAQAGRLYFCEHLTPQLVWQDNWRAHPNGAFELVEAHIQVAEPDREARLYRQLLGNEAVHEKLRGFVAHAAPVSIVATQGEGAPRMIGLTLRVRDLGQAAALLEAAGFGIVRSPGRVEVPAEQAWNIALGFVE